jgi:hypothetical protein
MSLPKFFERKGARVGETQSAGLNKTVSFVTLRIDPVRGAIRAAEPRFKALLAKHAFGEENAAR